jgi:putative DNA-invertase from lambdoid prophage Rac
VAVRFNYLRVSDSDQSVQAQRQALGDADEEFVDHGVSGAVLAADRPGFSRLLGKLRAGDQVRVYALDRLGRDAIDVQSMVRHLRGMGVSVYVRDLGEISGDAGEIIVAVLAQVSAMERRRIKERCDAGRAAARASLQATGLTHRGKASLGRPVAADAATVAAWRERGKASIADTAAHFKISVATVKRYVAETRAQAEVAA